MDRLDATRWSIVMGAAAGDAAARDEFAASYEPVVRAYLAARWRGTAYVRLIDDTVQDVFLDLLRAGGPLSRIEEGHPGGFRAYFYGVARIAALRAERSTARRDARANGAGGPRLERLPSDDPGASSAFDRAWAESIVRRAGALQRERARANGALAERRIELLRLRFDEGLPIREIALRWNEDPDHVHHEYAKARREFHRALLDEVAAHHPGVSPEVVAHEAEQLLRSLA